MGAVMLSIVGVAINVDYREVTTAGDSSGVDLVTPASGIYLFRLIFSKSPKVPNPLPLPDCERL